MIQYKINPKLKHSYITINEYGEITIKTPYKSQQALLKLLKDKENWIRKKINNITKKKPKIPDEVELFGAIIQVDKVPKLQNILNNIKMKTSQNIQKGYDRFYKQLAQEYIPQRVDHFAKNMKVDYKTIRFRKMKRRWGSCSKDGILTFNTNLMKKEKNFIDEVIVHELAHRVYFNHSKQFYDFMKQFI